MMEKVAGVGGVFLRARDPAALQRWYAEHLGKPEHRWSTNLRVRDLDAMVAQLEHAGIEVELDAEVYPNGRFAVLADPEGKPVQLWEPATGRGRARGLEPSETRA